MKKRESPVIFLARALLFFQSPGKGLSYDSYFLCYGALGPQRPSPLAGPKGVPWRENPLGNKEIFRIERDVVSCLYDFDFLVYIFNLHLTTSWLHEY